MASPIPLMVELCAGTAALSLRLHRDGARPPVSRQGAKTGYADAILKILGLHPGQRAALYLWCEPDPGVRLLLHAYRDAALAKAAAAIIRSWAGEDPRALWERLRAEGAPRLPAGEVEAGEVARWAVVGQWSYRNDPAHGFNPGETSEQQATATNHGQRAKTSSYIADKMELPALPATIAPDARAVDPREVARWAQITASNRLIHTAWSDAEGRWINTGDGGATFGGDAFATPPERTAEGFDAVAEVPAVVTPDAREVDPREVARWASLQDMSLNGKGPAAGMGALMTPVGTAAWSRHARGEPVDWKQCHGPAILAPKVDGLHTLPALIHPDARAVDPREVARGLWLAKRTLQDGRSFKHAMRVKPCKEPERAGRAWMPDDPAPALDAVSTLPALIHPDARTLDPPALPPGTVVFCDPPYQNTTGYAHDLPRAEVVALARRWAAAGATVAVSEAEPIPELVAEGWHAVEITGERVGQARTFSKQKSEWVTLNRPPAWTPPVQGRLF